VLRGHADDGQLVQLRRQGHGGLSHRGFLTDAGIVADPQQLADDFRVELLALARCARRIVA
jgi:hypothetical protein